MALTLGAGDGALECRAVAEDEGAQDEVDGKGGGAREEGVAAKADEGETKGRPLAEAPLAESPVEQCLAAAAWGGDATHALFADREGLVNEKVDTVFLGPRVGPLAGPAAAAGAGRFRLSAPVNRLTCRANGLNLGRK